LEELREVLLSLRSADQKWAERTQRLARLGQLVGCSESCNASTNSTTMLLTEAISALVDALTKQNNPHVLRAAIGAVRCVGECGSQLLGVVGVAWRQLLLETIHLLRAAAKPVHDEAREVLGMMHARGRVLSLAALTPMLEEILAGPSRGAKGGAGSSSSSGSGGGSGSSAGGASNTARVVQWLDSVCRAELDKASRQFSTAHSDAYRPSPFDKVDSAAVLARLRPLLVHREEATRDATLDWAANVLLLDMLQACPSVAVLISTSKQAQARLKKGPTAGDGAGAAASTPEAALSKALSAGGAAALADLASKGSARVTERLVGSVTKALAVLAQAVMVAHASAQGGGAGSGLVSPRASGSGPVGGSTGAAAVAASGRPPLGAAVVGAGASALDASTPRSRASKSGSSTSAPPVLPVTPVEPNPKPRPTVGVVSVPAHSHANANTNANVQQVVKPAGATGSPRGTGPAGLSLSLPSGLDTGKAAPSSPLGSDGGTASTTSASSGGSDRDDLPDPPLAPSLPPSPSAAQAQAQAVNNGWFEAKLVLRTLPNTETGFELLRQGSREAGVFFSSLTAAAQRCGVPRGQLLRVVLPFDENTSSNDQAAGSRTSPAAASAILAALDPGAVEELRSRAVSLRRLLRVKMADEADLLQAVAAAELLKKFVGNVEGLAASRGVSPVSIVRGLE